MQNIRSVFLIIFVICILFSLCACTAELNDPAEEKIILSKKQLDFDDQPYTDFSHVVKNQSVSEADNTNIPVYFEYDILYDAGESFELNRDSCLYDGFGAMQNSADSLFAKYPTNAIVKRADGDVYTVYETDTGYRLYLYFRQENDYMTTTGFPVLIKEKLSYEDFSSLKMGDTIEKVEAIDMAASLQKKTPLDYWNLDPVSAAGFAEDGYPVTTVHYLTDGFMKIEYEMKEDRSLVISDIVYAKDYTLTNPWGEELNYKINDADLPW